MNSTPDADAPVQEGSPDRPGGGNDDVNTYGTFNEQGRSTASVVLTPDSDMRCKRIHFDPRLPMPVIFLPGVMGSLLADKNTGATVWSAPNMDHVTSAIPGALSVVGGYFGSATQRETRLDPTVAVVDPRGPVEVGNSEISPEEATRRGWGTVHRWSYQPTLAWLQYTLSHPMLAGKVIGEWIENDPKGKKAALKKVLDTPPSDYGAYGGPIGECSDEFQSLLDYHYTVYAIGYNWLQSNQLSAQQVLDGMDYTDPKTKKVTRIMGIREICRENKTDKAIIITHSMGGIVARMASQLCGGADCMLGVIHGAQPATGAPVFAKRFRTGGEDFVSKSLMGRNDAEFVALAAFAEGPMELSPMPDYHDGKPWWIFTDKKDQVRMALPEQSALDEIYTSDAWYGLVPDSSILDPAGIVRKRLDDQKNSTSVHDYFKQTMSAVVARQNMLINNYHPNTYAMYGNGALISKSKDGTQPPPKLEVSQPQKKLETYGTVVWKGDLPAGVGLKELQAATLIKGSDNHHGVLKIQVAGPNGKQTVTLTVQQHAVAPEKPKDTGRGPRENHEDGDADSSGSIDGNGNTNGNATPEKNDDGDGDDTPNGIIHGDGTVPRWSAEAQGRGLIPGVSTETGKANGVQMVFVQGGYEHQFCFTHPWTRWASLYSVAQVMHSIKAKVP